MEYSQVLFTGDEIIGYASDILPLLKKEMHDVLDRYLRGEIDSEEMEIGLDYYKEIIKELELNNYDLIRITEHPMGGANIQELEVK